MIYVILGAFANLRTTSVDFITSAQIEQVKGHWTDGPEDLYWRFLLKSYEKIQFGTLLDDTNVLIISVAEFFLHWESFNPFWSYIGPRPTV
jgi:hypothetical protein